MELTNHAGFLFVPESSWLYSLCLPCLGFLSLGLPRFLCLSASLRGWAWDLGSHSCLVYGAASDKLPDPRAGWSLLSRNQLAGWLLCTCFATIGRPSESSVPTLEKFPGFVLFFYLIMTSRNLSWGVFCFLTCSSIWDINMASRFLLSFTIFLFSLSPSHSTPPFL